MSEPLESSSVVVFTGGPVLDDQVLRFVSRIEDEPAIDLVGIVSQSPVRGIRGVIVDLWRRRGIVALPILLRNGLAAMINTLFRPAVTLERRRSSNAVRDRTHFFDDIHSEDALNHVRSLNPALGLVYGGPIVRPELFSVPELGTLGIHHGKVPNYRGKKTTFWALYNGETEVGVIIQKISDRLDAGDIIRTVDSVRSQPSVAARHDKISNISASTCIWKLYKDVIDGKANYVPQPTGSRPLYKDPTAIELLQFWGRYLNQVVS